MRFCYYLDILSMIGYLSFIFIIVAGDVLIRPLCLRTPVRRWNSIRRLFSNNRLYKTSSSIEWRVFLLLLVSYCSLAALIMVAKFCCRMDGLSASIRHNKSVWHHTLHVSPSLYGRSTLCLCTHTCCTHLLDWVPSPAQWRPQSVDTSGSKAMQPS